MVLESVIHLIPIKFANYSSREGKFQYCQTGLFFCYPAQLHFTRFICCMAIVFKNLHLLPFRLPRQQSSMETTDRNEMWCANRCTYCSLAVHVVINSPERITTINSITLEENEIGGPKDEHKFVWVSMDHFGLFRIEFKSVPYSPGND